MQLLRPDGDDVDLTGPGDVTVAEDAIAAALNWPELTGKRPWVRANMIASLDGGTTLDGTSGGLGIPVDQRLIGIQRDLADAVLVGAGTLIAEGYPGAKNYPRRQRRRRRWARAGIPGWIVVADRALPDGLTAVTDSEIPLVVITTDDADQPAGVDVIRTGTAIDLDAALQQLADRGLHRLLCEGGPKLLGRLASAELIDELCLTIAPSLLGSGTAVPLLGGVDLAGPAPAKWTMVSLFAEGSHLFARYRRDR